MNFDKNIAELKAQADQSETNQQGRIYTEDFKKAVIEYHYLSGKKFMTISKEIGIHFSLVSKWKKKYGKERTGFAYGSGIRNDVRTKALCVKEFKEKSISKKDLAHAYNVGEGTIHAWIGRYGHNYKELLDTRDGVPYIVDEKDLIFGDKNIERVLEAKEKHIGELRELLAIMKKTGYELPVSMKKKIEKDKKKTKEEISILKKADIIMSK